MNKRLIILIVPLLAGVALVACGDDKSEPLTVPAYLQSLEIVFEDATTDSAFLREPENIELWLNDLSATQELLDRSIPVSEQTTERLDRLTAPPALQIPHQNMVSAFNGILASNRELKSRLAEIQTTEELQEFKSTELPLPGAVESAQALREACTALETYGSEQGIQVNLHCDEL